VSACQHHEGNEAFDLRGCTLCLKRRAALIDRTGSSSAQDSLTLTELQFIGIEPSPNGHHPKPRTWLSADRLLSRQAERDEEEAGRFVGLDQVGASQSLRDSAREYRVGQF